MHPVLWLIGYYEISVPVDSSARFLALAADLNIDYCDDGVFDRADQDLISSRRRFLVSARLAGRIVRACRDAQIDAVIEKKRGAPVWAIRLLRRPGIALGVLIFAALAILSEKVIWKIDVVGNDTLEYSKVRELLAEGGVRVGAFSSSLEVDKITNRILMSTDKISWMSINIVGTVATVEIRETLPPPSPEPPVCSNVIATQNGIVVGFDNVRGNQQVQIGDAVSQGDLLIGGVYGSENEATRFVRATGSVLARVSREFDINIPLAYSKKIYTGRQKTKKTLIFFEKEVKFFGNSGNYYATCDTIERVEYFNLFGLGELPIGIRTVTYAEYGYAECILGEDEARAEVKRALWQRFEEQSASGAELVSSDIDIVIENGACRLYAKIESIEDIAQEIEVQINITG